MRKEQLVKALVKAAKAKSRKRAPANQSSRAKSTRTKAVAKSNGRVTGSRVASSNGAKSSRAGGSKKAAPSRRSGSKSAATTRRATPTKAKRPAAQPKAKKKPKNPRIAGRIRKQQAEREKAKDLSTVCHLNGQSVGKDRIVLLVRDPYWLQACWDVTRQAVERGRAAMAEHWHMAVPTLRVLRVESGPTTSTTEQLVRDIEIHGGVKNWYIDIQEPVSYCVCLGFKASNGKFFTIARSNIVTPPAPGSSDAIDENWTDIAANYEKVYAMSGGYDEDHASTVLQEMFEERLRRPMGSPVVTKYGDGAEKILNRRRDFEFEVDAELIIYGSTKPDAHVSLANEPVKLRPDGTFTVRLSMPDKRQVLPVVASSSDGGEQRTIVLAVERNTKVMEPMIHESQD